MSRPEICAAPAELRNGALGLRSFSRRCTLVEANLEGKGTPAGERSHASIKLPPREGVKICWTPHLCRRKGVVQWLSNPK